MALVAEHQHAQGENGRALGSRAGGEQGHPPDEVPGPGGGPGSHHDQEERAERGDEAGDVHSVEQPQCHERGESGGHIAERRLESAGLARSTRL